MNLTHLDLSDNQLSGEIPPELGNLTSLWWLDLENNQLSGEIPPELGNLSLMLLRLSGNQFAGCIPTALADVADGADTDLHMIGLPFCQDAMGIEGDRAALIALYNATDGPNWTNNDGWLSDAPPSSWYGVTTDVTGRVTGLNLDQNQLNGAIPPELGNLTPLEHLYLSGNQLSGEIPPELGNLASLQQLVLSGNQLSGAIPPELGDPPHLWRLHLSGNQFTGCIPPRLAPDNDFYWTGLPFCGN